MNEDYLQIIIIENTSQESTAAQTHTHTHIRRKCVSVVDYFSQSEDEKGAGDRLVVGGWVGRKNRCEVGRMLS